MANPFTESHDGSQSIRRLAAWRIRLRNGFRRGHAHYVHTLSAVVEECFGGVREVSVGNETHRRLIETASTIRPASPYVRVPFARCRRSRRCPCGSPVSPGWRCQRAQSRRPVWRRSAWITGISADYASSMPLVADFYALDGHFVARRVHGRTFPFADPAVFEIPAQHVVVLFVLQDDGAVAPVGHAVEDVFVPVPKILVIRVSALQRDIGELAQPGQLSDGERRVLSLAIVDGVRRRGQARRIRGMTRRWCYPARRGSCSHEMDRREL